MPICEDALMTDAVYPIQPKQLPDGSIVWEEHGKAKAVIDALRAYDPRCSLVRNHTDVNIETGQVGCWEIWRLNENGEPNRVGSWWNDRLPEPEQVVAALAARDTWRGFDPYQHIVDAQEHKARVEGAAFDEAIAEHADRIHYEMVDELSAHMPAARPIPLAPSGNRRRVGTAEARRRGLL